MDRRFTFVGVGFGVLGLAIGGAIAFVLKPAVKHVLGTDDSPVLVRGGSIETLGASAWTTNSVANCSNVNVKSPYYSLSNDNTFVSMDGVQPIVGNTPGKPVSVSVSDISSNWSITLSFRDKTGRVDTGNNFEIQLSSFDPCQAIPSGGPGGTLYLADIGKTAGTLNADTAIDSVFRYRYDIGACDDGSADPKQSKCNHISQISVSGLSGSGQTITGPFNCRGGACSIGIGNP